MQAAFLCTQACGGFCGCGLCSGAREMSIQWTGKVEVYPICELQDGQVVLLYTTTKRNLRGSWDGPSDGDRQEAARGGKKGILSFILQSRTCDFLWWLELFIKDSKCLVLFTREEFHFINNIFKSLLKHMQMICLEQQYLGGDLFQQMCWFAGFFHSLVGSLRHIGFIVRFL